MRKYITTFLFISIIAALASTTIAFADQSERPASYGEAVGQVSGISVTNVHYELVPADPTSLAFVEFDTEVFQGTIAVKLDSTSNVFSSCVSTSRVHWLCQLTNTSIGSVDEFRVVSKGN